MEKNIKKNVFVYIYICKTKSLCCTAKIGASQVALVVKNSLSMQETLEAWNQSLGQEDPLEKEMTTHSSILA